MQACTKTVPNHNIFSDTANFDLFSWLSSIVNGSAEKNFKNDSQIQDSLNKKLPTW